MASTACKGKSPERLNRIAWLARATYSADMPDPARSLRILLLTSKYNRPDDGAYLTNDLARAWARSGHEVQVVSLEWDDSGADETFSDGPVKVIRVRPVVLHRLGAVFQRLAKWGLSARAALPRIRWHLADDAHYDLLVATAPLLNMGSVVRWALQRARQSYVYNPDFFPYYHHSIGLIPGGLAFRIARLAEQSLLRRFDVIGCMSPANVKFVRDHFDLRADQRTAVLHLWGDTRSPPAPNRAAVRVRHVLPPSAFIALFGGQLVEGRGVEDILAAAQLARTKAPDMLFLFVGRGRLEPIIRESMASGGHNVRVLAPMPREAYMELAASCDVGINATAAHVIVPTFPTKTIDYLRARLPIAASVERASDYGDFVEENGIGLQVPAGDPEALLAIIMRMANDPAAVSAMTDAAQAALDRHMDVDLAARAIIAAADCA